MRVEFDSEKDRLNRQKHALPLSFGAEILKDRRRLDILDTRRDYGEDRYICYGMVSLVIYVCVYTLRGQATRIISVRKANEREVQRYFAAGR
ncbi:BrnT family toxin [Caenispirillum bisanense]|uniref:BrnT family toxin n=1 Tax=Caenispirillum bisanense TaxID=414052 RepID=UPI0031D16B5C